jgi:NOL1/NOP2/sun family putative RNA methylase
MMTTALPPKYCERMETLLGDEFPQFRAIYQQPPSVGLRVNTLKLTPESFQAIAPFPLRPIPWVEEGFEVVGQDRPGRHPYHAAGLYYLQDPAAMAVVAILDPQPGDRILDLAAAPGGKSTHLAARLQGQGWLIANDIHPKRVQALARNLERWGARNVAVLNETPDHLADHFGPLFDAVLVDAPCSGEGMFRKEPAARREWRPQQIVRCAQRQTAILHHAARLVKPGGRLVYATCTFAPEENEGIIAQFVETHPDFELIPVPQKPGFDAGRPEWLANNSAAKVEYTVRLWPHRTMGEGHFIAVMRKSAADDEASWTAPHRRTTAPRLEGKLLDQLLDFQQKHLNINLEALEGLCVRGNRLYAVPSDMPSLVGLKVTHWGWWLGTFRTRFIPSNALALGLQAEAVKCSRNWMVSDAPLQRILQGQTIPDTGPDGWVLISVDGFPLGWGKRVNGRLKSHLPRWLLTL